MKSPPSVLAAYRVADEDDLVLFVWETADERPAVALSRAEREVLALVAEGHPNAEIARRRKASIRTVANQVASLLKKTGASSRFELIARAGSR